MAKFYKQAFNREGRPLARKLIFIGQYEPDIDTGTGFSGDDVLITVEGETTAFILSLSADEAQRIRAYLDHMGY